MFMKKLLPVFAVFALFLANSLFAGTVVQFQLSSLGKAIGSFEVELYDQDKPVTVSNFLAYVNSGLYDNSFFHRSVPGFVIQGGGYTCAISTGELSTSNVDQIPVFGTIIGEADTNTFYSNTNGTIAMALSSGPNTATSQFFFNLADNTFLDGTSDGGPFTVFGRVIKGYNVLLSLENYPVVDAAAVSFVFSDLPVKSGVNGATVTPPCDDLIYYNISIVENTNRPALSITGPKTSSSTTNTVQNLTGTTTGSLTLDGIGRVPVNAVYFSVNGGQWNLAEPSNNWTNWTAQAQLAAGYNTVAAYAVDTNGNTSPTNSIEVFCIQHSTLLVQTNGNGSVNPNDNGKSLIIGDRYSLTAKPSGGFGFVKWTDQNGGLLSTKATLTFNMTAGENLIAWFADVTRPTLSVTSPKAGAKITSTPITAAGTAKDNVGVAAVWYQMNGGGWHEAATTNNFSNWTATNLTVISGANVFMAYAQDAAGNKSATNSVKFTGTLP